MSKTTRRLALLMALWLLLAVAALRLIPPFSSPDENSHLLRANMISQGQWRMEPAPATAPRALGGMGGQVDQGWWHYMLQALQWQFSSTALTQLALGSTPLETPASKQDLRQRGENAHWAHTTIFVAASGTNYYNPLIYAPHAAMLWLGRHLDLSLAASHDAIRLATILLCIALAGTAMRLLAFPVIALGIVATPMALFQWYSPTIDGLATGLAMLAVALFLREANHPPGQQRTARVLWLAASVTLLATTRIHLLPMLLLPLWLAMRQHPSQRSAKNWLPGVGAVACSGAWFAFALTTTLDTRLQRQHSTLEIAIIYLRDPLAFIKLLQRTLTDTEMQRFYVQSFIGNLGWLDTPVAPPHVLGTGLGLAALFVVSVARLALSRKTATTKAAAATPTDLAISRALLLVVGAASIILAFMALAITWNDYPATVIQGLQGRYFTLPLFIAACALWDGYSPALQPSNTATQQHGRWVGTALLAAYFAYACAVTGLTLAARYP